MYESFSAAAAAAAGRCSYVHDLHQLRSFGACLHLLQDPPAAILVDDLARLLANTRWVLCMPAMV